MALFFSYITVVITCAALDFFWIGFAMKGAYDRGLGHLLAPSFNLLGALAFYLLYAAGILVFIVLPAEGKTVANLVVRAAFFGLVCYGVYDLTNLATLRNWPLSITIMDMVWGAVLTTVASAAGFLVLRSF